MGSCRYATAPARNSAIISSEVATGRRMNGRDGLMFVVSLLRVRSADGYLRAILQPVECASRQLHAWFDPGNCRLFLIARKDFNVLYAHRVVGVHYVHKSLRSVVLHRACRNQRRPA